MWHMSFIIRLFKVEVLMSTCFVFCVFDYSIPVIIVCILVIVGEHDVDNIDSAFFYGKAQVSPVKNHGIY